MSCRLHRDCLPRRHAGPRVITGADGTGVECGRAAQTPPWLHAPPARPDASSVRRAAGPAQDLRSGWPSAPPPRLPSRAGRTSTRVEDEKLGPSTDQCRRGCRPGRGWATTARGEAAARLTDIAASSPAGCLRCRRVTIRASPGRPPTKRHSSPSTGKAGVTIRASPAAAPTERHSRASAQGERYGWIVLPLLPTDRHTPRRLRAQRTVTRRPLRSSAPACARP
jgi:hypothetical protein